MASKTKRKPAAKKAAPAKAKAISKPGGKVDAFIPARDGTDRATVIRMGAKGTQTVEQIAAELKKDRRTVMTILNLLRLRSGFGYKIADDNKVTVTFPGSKTLADAIR